MPSPRTLTLAMALVLVGSFHSHSQSADEGTGKKRQKDVITDRVNGELTDVAHALRRLDQSYGFRGIQGCGAWTAGSTFVDFGSRGEEPHAVSPPPPLRLGGCQSACPLALAATNPVEQPAPCQNGTEFPRLLTADTAAAVSAVRFQLLDEACLGATHRFATNGESYRVEGIADALLAAARASHRLRIDITLQSAASTVGFVPIVSFAKRADCGNFLLGQSGNTLVLRLRTNTAAQSPPRLFEVALAEINQDVHHLVVSYSSARLTVAVDDKELGCLRELTGGFSNWTPQPLFLGNPANGVSWNGTLNSIVLETEF